MSDTSAESSTRTGNQGAGATAHVVATLTHAIREGSFPAGERLVESRLTKQLGVSRSSVREALRRLESNGLVEIEPHRGAIVRAIGRSEIAEILAVREVLEGLAAAQAARNVEKDTNRHKVGQALHRVQAVRSKNVRVNYLEDNLAFHELVVELADNGTLAQQINQLQLPVSRYRFFDLLNTSDWDRSLLEHEFILGAILDGDPVLAEQLMRAHIRRTIRMINRMPEEQFDVAGS